jgi:hypothetical protein
VNKDKCGDPTTSTLKNCSKRGNRPCFPQLVQFAFSDAIALLRQYWGQSVIPESSCEIRSISLRARDSRRIVHSSHTVRSTQFPEQLQLVHCSTRHQRTSTYYPLLTTQIADHQVHGVQHHSHEDRVICVLAVLLPARSQDPSMPILIATGVRSFLLLSQEGKREGNELQSHPSRSLSHAGNRQTSMTSKILHCL